MKIELIKIEDMQEFPDNITDENIILAKKINEIISIVNNILPCEHLETEINLMLMMKECKKCGVMLS